MKVVAKISVAVILIVLIAAVLFVMNAGKIIERGINDYGPELSGLPLSVDAVTLDVFQGQASLRGFRIRNPQGFSDADAFTLHHIAVALDVQSLRNPVVVIDEIVIDGASVLVEQRGRAVNLQKIKDRLDAKARSSSGSAPVTTAGDDRPLPAVAIGRVVFANASARVTGDNVDDQKVSIPTVTLDNIGSAEKGIQLDQAAQAILQPLLQRVIAVVQREALDKVVRKEIDKALGSDKFKGFLDKLKRD